jgi:hypothetical protein
MCEDCTIISRFTSRGSLEGISHDSEELLSLIISLVFSARSHDLEIPQSSQYLAFLGYLLP